jgi:hypothetical protein
VPLFLHSTIIIPKISPNCKYLYQNIL